MTRIVEGMQKGDVSTVAHALGGAVKELVSIPDPFLATVKQWMDTRTQAAKPDPPLTFTDLQAKLEVAIRKSDQDAMGAVLKVAQKLVKTPQGQFVGVGAPTPKAALTPKAPVTTKASGLPRTPAVVSNGSALRQPPLPQVAQPTPPPKQKSSKQVESKTAAASVPTQKGDDEMPQYSPTFVPTEYDEDETPVERKTPSKRKVHEVGSKQAQQAARADAWKKKQQEQLRQPTSNKPQRELPFSPTEEPDIPPSPVAHSSVKMEEPESAVIGDVPGVKGLTPKKRKLRPALLTKSAKPRVAVFGPLPSVEDLAQELSGKVNNSSKMEDLCLCFRPPPKASQVREVLLKNPAMFSIGQSGGDSQTLITLIDPDKAQALKKVSDVLHTEPFSKPTIDPGEAGPLILRAAEFALSANPVTLVDLMRKIAGNTLQKISEVLPGKYPANMPIVLACFVDALVRFERSLVPKRDSIEVALGPVLHETIFKAWKMGNVPGTQFLANLLIRWHGLEYFAFGKCLDKPRESMWLLISYAGKDGVPDKDKEDNKGWYGVLNLKEPDLPASAPDKENATNNVHSVAPKLEPEDDENSPRKKQKVDTLAPHA